MKVYLYVCFKISTREQVYCKEYCTLRIFIVILQTTVELHTMINRVIREGLEGLVLKDPQGHYEPGKRHWMKMKKDYLAEGAMADTADLVVLGAWLGTGNKGLYLLS